MRRNSANAAAIIAAATSLMFTCDCVAFDVRQVVEQEVLGGIWPSPDGKWVMYAVDRASVGENRITTSFWVKSVDDVRPPVQQMVEGHAFNWLPNSQALLYADTKNDVLLWNFRTGAPDIVISARKLKDIFPDAASISIAEIHAAPVTDIVALIVQLTGRLDDHPLHGVEVDLSWWAPADTAIPGIVLPKTRTTIVTLDRKTGRITKLLPDQYDVSGYLLGEDSQSVAWSPNGKRLAFTASLLQPPGQPNSYMLSDLYLVDMETRAVTALVTTSGFEYMPRWSPDGRKIAIRTQGGRADWRYDSMIGVVDVSGERLQYWIPTVGQSEDPRTRYVAPGGWSQDSQTLFFAAPVRGHMRFMSLDLRTRELAEAVPHQSIDLGFYSGPRQSKDSGLFVLEGASFDRWSDLYVWRPGARELQKLTSLNRKLNALSPHCNVEEVNWSSDDGKWQLQGFLLTPVGTKKSSKLPLLVYVGGGPNMVGAQLNMLEARGQYPWPLFIQGGYAIFLPNTRGREGFGARFHHSLKDESSMNRLPATDVISGVRYLIEQGRVDPKRIGITAHSYGGAVAASALTQTDLFNAASIHEGIAFFLTSSDRYTAEAWRNEQMSAFGIGSPLDPSRRALLMADSPGEHADKIKAPVLLESGVRAGAAIQGRQFFQALRYFNVPAEFIVYPRTGHNTTEPKLIEDSYQRNIEWFDYWLKGIATKRMLERYGPPKIVRLN